MTRSGNSSNNPLDLYIYIMYDYFFSIIHFTIDILIREKLVLFVEREDI